jgi:hypothetical protein
MSNYKQSSVEQFAIALYEKGLLIGNGDWMQDILNEYKAMHKEEMIEFGNDLLAQNDTTYIAMPNLSEQYYNQLFGGNK